MDPNAALQNLKRFLEKGYDEDAQEVCADLLEWIDKGGFPPKSASLVELPGYVPRSSPLAVLVNSLNQHIVVEK